MSKAQVIRRMLDEGLGIDDGAEARRRAILAAAGVLPHVQDWETWLAGVRGGGAYARLERLGR